MDFSNRLTKYHEGWLENKVLDSGRWVNHWCVMKSHTLFFFTSSDTREDTHVGTLTITSESKLTKLKGDETQGYQFELHTKNRKNQFRTQKFYERELWKAYIEGVAKCDVPENIDLPPEQIQQIRRTLGQNPVFFSMPSNEFRTGPNDRTGFDSPNSSDSGTFHVAPNPGEEDYLPPVDYIESDIRDGHTITQMYRFCSEKAGNVVPRWFFFRCSREAAEEILINGKKYGNTLMRVSPCDANSLVISKRIETTMPSSFIHYRVLEEPKGYRLEVTNPHSPMGTLSDVMDFFVRTAGKSTTIPMTSNNVNQILKKNHDYGKFINTPPLSLEEYEGPPPMPAPPPPPHFIRPPQVTTGVSNRSRSMSVPAIPPSNLPKQPKPDDETPPPLPPNHPKRIPDRRGSETQNLIFHKSSSETHSKHPSGGSISTGSTRSLNCEPQRRPLPPQSKVTSEVVAKPQSPTNSKVSRTPVQHQAPPVVPSSPAPPLPGKKSSVGTSGLILSNTRRVTTDKPEPPSVAPKPVLARAPPELQEMLNRPRPPPMSEMRTGEGIYENLDQLTRDS